jgi:hypothetical protein
MNKFWMVLLTGALILAACAPAAEPATSAPQGVVSTNLPAPGDTPTTPPQLTQEVGAVVLGTPTPAATPASTLGGPVVITVEPGGQGTAQPGGQPELLPTPIPTLKGGLGPTELKYHVLAAYPTLFYCDPDEYPVAVADQDKLAERRFPSLQANAEEFQAILAHNHLSGPDFTAAQKLTIYQAHKQLAAIRFTLMGDQYQFQLQTKDAGGQGQLVTGLIDGQGAMSAQQSQPAMATCPV